MSQFFRGMLAVLTPVLTAELGMTNSQLSVASSVWFLTFAFAQFPIGYFLDTRGPRLTASLLLGLFGGGGSLWFAYATTPQDIIFAMAMIGIGCAPVLMATFMIFSREFRSDLFATLSSTFVSLGLLGSVMGSQPLVWAVEKFGWRECSLGFALFTVLLAILIFLFTKTHTPVANAKQGSFLKVLSIRALWPIFPLIFVAYATAASIRGLWIAPVMLEVHGATIHEIGLVTLAMSVAQIVGTLFYGPLDRLFNTRKWVVLIGNLVVVAALAVIAFDISLQITAFAGLIVVIGLFSASYAVQMAHGRSLIPEHMTGRGITLMNFFSIGGAAVVQYLSGRLVEFAPTMFPQTSEFALLFGFYTMIMAIALVIYLFCQDTKPGQRTIQ